MRAVASVWPFRVNRYVVDELIDWDQVPNDPMFQLTMPQPGMLEPGDLDQVTHLLRVDAPPERMRETVRKIRAEMNPHPGGQMQLNIPAVGNLPVQGIQHKYRETVLFFPSAGQTCHAYCNYCFRWAQFVGDTNLRFATNHAGVLATYLETKPEVTDILITGGDPMVMKTKVLRRFIEPLLAPELAHVTNIRIGTKSLSFWPARFTEDDDASDLLRLFERICRSGRHLSIMAHFSHFRELETPQVRQAITQIRNTGASIRSQAPIIRGVNDDAGVWRQMWTQQVNLGISPYYTFIARDTGPKNYFQVPLARAHQIFSTAMRQVSGLARTARGPSMSTTSGKILIDGVETIQDQKVFILKFLQARQSELAQRLFFAKFNDKAAWLSELEPAFGSPEVYFRDTVAPSAISFED